MDKYFLREKIPCDFDVVCYYIKFANLLHLHHKNIYTRERLESNFELIFDLVLKKELVCNNIRRYLSIYVNETLKNLSSEFLNCINVDPSIGTFITKMIDAFYRNLHQFESELSTSIACSKNKLDFYNNTKNSVIFKKYGWF
jgi:hypothetical protein